MDRLDHKDWKGTTGGMPWMQKALVVIFKVVPVIILYGVMALVVPFYMGLHRSGYRACYRFFRERLGWGPLKSFGGVYRNHFVFGEVILDRFAKYAGKKYSFEVEGVEAFQALLNSPEGIEILSAHVGNYELAGYTLSTAPKKLHALVFAGETETVMSNRNRMFSGNNVAMVPMSEDMSHIFTLNAALAGGDIVSMPGDRIFGSSKSIGCQFFGQQARFPAGPFVLAARRKAPVVAIFVMKEGIRRYRVVIEKLEYSSEKDLAAGYAAVLEKNVRRWPLQWFNYFDFWQE